MPTQRDMGTQVFRLTGAGTLEACGLGALRAGDVYTQEESPRGRRWWLAEARPSRIRGGWRVRGRDASAMMQHIRLAGAEMAVADAVDHAPEEGADLATPLSALLDREASRWGIFDRSGHYGDFLAYCFTDGPHPAEVMRRVYELAAVHEPALVRDLPPRVVALLRATASEQHLFRVGLLLVGTQAEHRSAQAHERIVQRTLTLAAARRPRTGVARVALAELLHMRADEHLDDYEARMRSLTGLLRFAFYDGPAAGVVVRRVFALAKWRPTSSALLFDMTLAHLGAMFGETRAAWSWRVKRLVNRFLTLANSTHGVKAGYQRTDEACAHCASAQRGNQNRIGGAAKVA